MSDQAPQEHAEEPTFAPRETPSREQLLELAKRLSRHARIIQEANAHDAAYCLGWRAGTNTCLAALRGLLDGGEWPLIEEELIDAAIHPEGESRRIERTSQLIEDAPPGANTLDDAGNNWERVDMRISYRASRWTLGRLRQHKESIEACCGAPPPSLLEPHVIVTRSDVERDALLRAAVNAVLTLIDDQAYQLQQRLSYQEDLAASRTWAAARGV